MTCRSSAPGKAFIAGEYAVLHGAPAFVMALDVRAGVAFEPDDSGHILLRGPGFTDVVGELRHAQQAWQWHAGEAEFALFRALADGVGGLRSGSFELDTRDFRQGGQKLGLGSSAALSASLAVLFAELDTELVAAVHAADRHRRFQNDVGSGADVAAALAGGFVEYRMNEDGWLRLDWPQDLAYRFFFSGRGAGTPERVRAALDGDGAGPLCEAAERLVPAMRSNRADAVLLALDSWTASLRSYGDSNGLDIFGGGHDVLCDAASSLGAVYKPCGAGGGDIGVALSTDAGRLDAFASLAGSHGFTPLPAQLDPVGAHVSEWLS